MSKPTKYKMRPAKKNAKGKPQMVTLGYINGHPSALTSEGEHEVTPAMHRAWLNGDLEIDGYPHERPKQGGAKAENTEHKDAAKEAAKAKRAEKAAAKKAEAEAKVKAEEEAKATAEEAAKEAAEAEEAKESEAGDTAEDAPQVEMTTAEES